ncbi:hormogonium polysaccharide biosynthesis glycosyltransferase HpsE [Lyngbya aestuarii]|uniref:hormogonium polysaccharide biosynthesis glycosyltransferase HpsE n=1 Tax=Lyngbya aestuarii TaxID=118322 RepID=UPI00403DD3C1
MQTKLVIKSMINQGMKHYQYDTKNRRNIVDFTIAIPTYNGESRLPRVFEKLRECCTYIAQETVEAKKISGEIIVIDNNSQDNTAKVVQEYQNIWQEAYPLKYCFEAKQGLAFARQRAVDEAQGTFIAFLDDDLLPASDWLASAYFFAQKHPQAGAYGGQIHGDFAIPPPENFSRIQSFLAIRERGSTAHLYEPQKLILPPGCGLVVRKQAWCENVPRRLSLTGRVKGEMIAGEDYEALLHIHSAGWEIWYNPAMHSYHQIPHQRLEKDYLIPLVRGCGLCTCHLRLVNIPTWKKPVIMLKVMLGGWQRLLRHLIKHRWPVADNLVLACEREFLLSVSLSPFYFLRKSLQNKTIEVTDSF